MAVKGLLGKKLGMVQVILEDGRVVGCTAIEVGPCAVTQIMKTDRNGYQAVQVGFGSVPDWRVTKPERGHTGSNGPLRHLAEFEADAPDYESLTVGQTNHGRRGLPNRESGGRAGHHQGQRFCRFRETAWV